MHARFRGTPFFAVLVGVVLAAEFYFVFLDRTGEFRIEGQEAYHLERFGYGSVVAHSFLMRGDGLTAVRVRFDSKLALNATIEWRLWRGSPDELPMTLAFESIDTVEMRPGTQWQRFSVTRDASSRDRWYTFEARLVSPIANRDNQSPPTLSVIATSDNPERGGVLWLDGVRQPGSLVLSAERIGRTAVRRFTAEVEPNLAPLLRSRVVQTLIAFAFHWAVFVYLFAVFQESRNLGSK